MKKINKIGKNAITLIALVITIIIILILAGVTLTILIGENGLFAKTIKTKEMYEQKSAKERLELVLKEMQIDKRANNEYNKEEYLTNKIKENGIEVSGNYVVVDGYNFEIDRDILEIVSGGSKNEEIRTNESIIGKISTINTTGYYKIELTAKPEEQIKYNVHLLNYDGDLILDGVKQVEGSTLTNNIYEFGDKDTDVATKTEDAKNMVIIKVNGNLIINENITLTACKSTDGYGGPKGILIYCTGSITNKGTISMTARGARANGEDVYLWQNSDKSYEYIPAVGANGAEPKSIAGLTATDSITTNDTFFGNNGENGIKRQSGGGGSGSAQAWRSTNMGTTTALKGGNGTSYSGGSGSGGIRIDVSGNSSTYNGYAASENGGAGGDGNARQGNQSSVYAGGGSGNPGGLGNYSSSGWTMRAYPNSNGQNGTGGLLIINALNVNNFGIIESNGTDALPKSAQTLKGSGGGGSGAGSINIFYRNEYKQTGKVEAIGGIGGYLTTKGGNGGSGAITIGSILTGTFIEKGK